LGFSPGNIQKEMTIQAEYKIKIKGLENYRVCEDGSIWRLQIVDTMGRTRKPIRVTKDEKRDAYRIGSKYYTTRQISEAMVPDKTIILNSKKTCLI